MFYTALGRLENITENKVEKHCITFIEYYNQLLELLKSSSRYTLNGHKLIRHKLSY